MPPRGWATVSVREDVRRALEEIASQKGFSSLNDVIVFLLDKYREFTDISVKLTDMSVRYDKLLTDISVKLDKLIQAGMTPSQIGVNSGNPSAQTATQGKAKSEEKERIKVISLEWAEKKGINIEEYMAKKEKQGYICNEANRKIYCIWREDIEQVIVDLNNTGTKMGELEKALNGEKLETAKVAIEAGLMWYDNREKRWRAPL
jgi:hypothetical protein